jgi:HlyD family secretion protein
MLSSALAIALMAVGCTGDGGPPPPPPTQTSKSAESPTVGTAPTPATASPSIDASAGRTPVRRGAIEQVVNLAGQVVGDIDTVVTVPGPTRVRRMLVSPGQSVAEGQPLVETGEPDRPTQIEQAQQRQRAADTRVTRATSRIESRLRDVSADVSQLERGAGNASPSNLMLAQSAVLQTRADLQRAEADLERLTAPASDIDVRAADQEVKAAEIALRKSEDDRARVLKGPDENEIRKAEGVVITAEARVLQAVEVLRKLSSESGSQAVETAEKAVKDAQVALQAAREPPAEIAASRAIVAASRGRSSKEREAMREMAIRNVEAARVRQRATIERAEADLKRSIDRLIEVKQGAGKQEYEVASRDFRNALGALGEARERLTTVQAGPTKIQIDQADSAREASVVTLERAQAKRAALDAGPPTDRLNVAQTAVNAARTAARAAETSVTEITTQQASQAQQLSQSKSEASLLQSVLEGKADLTALTATENPDPDIVEIAQAQTELETSESSLSALLEDPGTATLVAPSAGMVTALHTGPGEQLAPGRPAVTLIRTSDLSFQASFDNTSALPIAVGMGARIRLNSAPGTDLMATVNRIDEANGGQTVRFAPSWSPPLPAIGTAGQASILMQRKEDALIVPREAVQAQDGRSSVLIVTGTTVQRTDIGVGLQNETEVEVTAGLQDGQIVVTSRR